jgi:hypothetical protein
MWTTILLLLAGFAIGVVFILLAQIAVLAFLSVGLDDEMRATSAAPMPAVPPPVPARAGYPASPTWPHPAAAGSPPYPRYPGEHNSFSRRREYPS